MDTTSKWLFALLFAFILCLISIVTYAAKTASSCATDVQEYKTKVEVLKGTYQLDISNIKDGIKEIKDDVKDIKSKIK